MISDQQRDLILLRLADAVVRLERRQDELESELKAVAADTASILADLQAKLNPIALAAQRSLARRADGGQVN